MWSATLLSLLVAVLSAAPVEPVAPTQVEHTIVRTPSDVDVHVLRFSPGRFELRLLGPGEGRRSARVSEMGSAAGALLAVNASYFLEDFTPLGLLISGGHVRQKPRKVDWGVFFVKDGRAGLVHVRDLADTTGLEFAVQAGPRLVVEGRATALKPQRARRTMIGIDGQGRVVLAVSVLPLSLSEAADFLIAQGVVSALNLDGGPSSQLYYPGAGVALESFSSVANAIGVFPRSLP
jgi:uncharacterized protein YigE (DUF2233 family)